MPADPSTPVTAIECRDARTPIGIYTSVRTARNSVYFSTRTETLATGFDIGVVVLGQDVDGANASTGEKLVPLASMQVAADRALAYRDGVIVVGFGGNKTIRPDSTTGTKRWASAKVAESISNAFETMGPKAAIAHGDSGGPAYIYDRSGRRRLIGIASGTPNGKRVSMTGIPDVSLYASMRTKLACWIEENSGYSLPRLPGSVGCADENPELPETEEFGAR